MSDIVEDLLFGTEEAIEAVEETSSRPIPKKTKPVSAEDAPASPPDLLTEISKAIQNLLNPVNQRLDDIEKRLAQPVQFRTSEPATESRSAERREAAKPTGPAGQ